MWNDLDLTTKGNLYRAYKQVDPGMSYTDIRDDFDSYADGGTVRDDDDEFTNIDWSKIKLSDDRDSSKQVRYGGGKRIDYGGGKRIDYGGGANERVIRDNSDKRDFRDTREVSGSRVSGGVKAAVPATSSLLSGASYSRGQNFRAQNLEVFDSYYDLVESSDPETGRYRNFLTKLAERESAFIADIKNPNSPAYGYFQFMEDGRTYKNIQKFAGTDVATFRRDPELQIRSAIKLAKAFQSEFTAEDRALANKLGYSEEALLGGAWMGGVGNVRKFLRSGVDTSDRGWSPSGAGSSVAEYMRLFNNQGGTGANGGGVPKYKDGGTVGRDSGDFRDFSDTDYTARQDKTYVASPQLYPEARRMYPQPSQQPTVGQYVKKTPYEQRLIDTQVAERRKSQWLYDNQHLWNVNSMNGIQPNITPENVDFEFNNSKDTAKATAETLAFEAGAPFMLGAALKGGEYVKNANIPGKVSDTVKKLWNDARGTTVYTGDPLELYLKRLNNGGYKKLGIDPNKVIEVPDQMFLDQHTSTHANRLHTVADALYQQRPIFKKTTIADDVENMKVVTFDDLRSILSRESRSAYNPISNHIGLDRIDMSSTTRKGIALAHELDHKVLSMTNRTNHDYADLSTFLKHNPNESVVSATTAIKSPLNLPALTDIPGTDVSKVLDANGNVDHALGAYFLGSDGAESIARTGQLKNFFGMTNPNKKLTVRQFNFAKKHYPTHKYGTDNDMVNFFKFVTKPKEFLKWANPRTIGVVPAVPILSSELADKNKKIKHNK